MSQIPIEQLKAIEDRYESLLAQLSDPAVATSGQRLRELSQAQAELQPLVTAARRLRELDRQAAEAQGLLTGESDAELRAMVEAELTALGEERRQLIARMEDLLLPRDPRDAKNVIVEIRAGTGGDEAGLFAAYL